MLHDMFALWELRRMRSTIGLRSVLFARLGLG
jgi:hypothetical protein